MYQINLTVQGNDAGELRESLVANIMDALDRISMLTGRNKNMLLAGLCSDLRIKGLDL